MSATIAEVNAVIERLWPLDGAEGWDAPGFLVGTPTAPVRSIHLAVDAVAESIDEAIELGADLLLVHHPLEGGSAQQQPRQKMPCRNPIRNAPLDPSRQLLIRNPSGLWHRARHRVLSGVS